MSKNVLIVIGLALVVFGLAFVIHRAGSPAPAQPQSAVSATTTSETGSAAVTASDTSLPSKKKTSMYTQATLKTNFGDIVIAFDPQLAPKTVENFTKLASKNYFDGIKFHRVIKGFMIQAGDPQSKDDSKQALWGTGGPGYQFDDEITPQSLNVKGAVSMANAGPNTNGSQFFVNVADNSFLNGKYTVFGHVTSGYDIVEKISVVPTDPSNDRPLSPVVINSVELK